MVTPGEGEGNAMAASQRHLVAACPKQNQKLVAASTPVEALVAQLQAGKSADAYLEVLLIDNPGNWQYEGESDYDAYRDEQEQLLDTIESNLGKADVGGKKESDHSHRVLQVIPTVQQSLVDRTGSWELYPVVRDHLSTKSVRSETRA
jgi:hypothetical protein